MQSESVENNKWPKLKKAIYDVIIAAELNGRKYIFASELVDKLYEAALTAQVQDVVEPKGYAALHAHTVRQAAMRAENDKDTLHLADSLYDAMRWIEAMADKQFVPEKITREMDYAGHDKFVDVSSTRYTGSDPHREIFNAMLAAAPAKQDGKP